MIWIDSSTKDMGDNQSTRRLADTTAHSYDKRIMTTNIAMCTPPKPAIVQTKNICFHGVAERTKSNFIITMYSTKSRDHIIWLTIAFGESFYSILIFIFYTSMMRYSTRQTFRQIVQRFFEPAFQEPINIVKSVLLRSLRSWFTILSIYILKEFVTILEQWDKEIFTTYLYDHKNRIFLLLLIYYPYHRS